MSVFLDTNVFVYARVSATEAIAVNSEQVLTAAVEGRLDARTSTGVIEELWHLELRGRPAGLDGVTGDAIDLIGPLLPITEDLFRVALELEAPPSLGANDRLHIAACLSSGIETIISADRAFGGFPGLAWIDLGSEAAVAELLARAA